MLTEKEYLLALSTFVSFGSSRIKLLIDYFENARKAWNAEVKDLVSIGISSKMANDFKKYKKTFDIKRYLTVLRKNEVDFLTVDDINYPQNLKEISHPPLTLYIKGQIPKSINKAAVAIVGTRKMTSYGKKIARLFSSRLSALGFTIVSGLARGIDTEAHKNALYKKGGTVAVLGSGFSTIYPPENSGLAKAIVKNKGALVSEYPFYFPVRPQNFAARNRIISGLAQAVIVIEGRRKSGTLLTASHAAEQGKTVFAVPGPIDSVMSEAPLFLIKNGANIASSVDDVLKELF